jgi:hypothetical protein
VLFLKFSVAIIRKLRKSPDLSIYGSSMVAKKYRKMFFFILSYLASSQIWLNLLVDRRHFGYITKLTQKNSGISAFLRSIYGEHGWTHGREHRFLPSLLGSGGRVQAAAGVLGSERERF